MKLLNTLFFVVITVLLATDIQAQMSKRPTSKHIYTDQGVSLKKTNTPVPVTKRMTQPEQPLPVIVHEQEEPQTRATTPQEVTTTPQSRKNPNFIFALLAEQDRNARDKATTQQQLLEQARREQMTGAMLTQQEQERQTQLLQRKLAQKRAQRENRKQQRTITITWDDTSTLESLQTTLSQNIQAITCINIPGFVLRTIANHCPQLKILDLTGNQDILGDDLYHIIKKCQQLEVLNLSHCQHVDREMMQEVAQAPSLKELIVRGCNNIYDLSFEALLRNQKTLEYIDLTGCSQINNEDLSILAQIRSLKTIIVKGCKGITASYKQQLRTQGINVID